MLKQLPGYVCDPKEIEIKVFLKQHRHVGITFFCHGKPVFTDSIKIFESKPKSIADIHQCVATACTAMANMYGFDGDSFYEFVSDENYLLVKNVVENLELVRSRTGARVWERN